MIGTTTGILRTLDSGKTWRTILTGESGVTEAIFAYTTYKDSVIFEFSDSEQKSQKLYITGDSGKTWRSSPVLSNVGPILWYGNELCQILHLKAASGSFLVQYDNVFKPVSKSTTFATNTSRYVEQYVLFAGMAFDESTTILFGRDKTIFQRSANDKAFQLISHLPVVTSGWLANYQRTICYGDSLLSWQGLRQLYITSKNAGVTWWPCQIPTREYRDFSSAAWYKILSTSCFIGTTTSRVADITTDGGNSFTRYGMFENDGSVLDDNLSPAVIVSADEVYKATKETHLGIFYITDSCRKWTLQKSYLRYLELTSDSIWIERRPMQLAKAGDALFMMIHEIRQVGTNGTPKLRYLLIRSTDRFASADTVFNRDDASIFVSMTAGQTIRCMLENVKSGRVFIHSSNDAGVTWDSVLKDDAPREYYMTIPFKNFACADKERKKILLTTDSGQVWSECHVPITDSSRFDLSTIGNTGKWAYFATNDGGPSALYRIDFALDSGITQSVESEPPSKPSPVWVRAAIPNPFSTIVSFTIGAAPGVPRAEVQVGVYSIDGRKITDLSSEYMQRVPGENGEVTLQWDGAQAAQGIYRIVVQNPQGTQSVSVIKAR
jgi:hypothetical protein